MHCIDFAFKLLPSGPCAESVVVTCMVDCVTQSRPKSATIRSCIHYVPVTSNPLGCPDINPSGWSPRTETL